MFIWIMKRLLWHSLVDQLVDYQFKTVTGVFEKDYDLHSKFTFSISNEYYMYMVDKFTPPCPLFLVLYM